MTPSPSIRIVAAMSHDGIIGCNGRLPWDIPEEYSHFLNLVRNETVIIGRRSFEVFGADLPGTNTIVLTKSALSLSNAAIAVDIPDALAAAVVAGRTIYCAGGASVYRQMLPMCDSIHLSIVHGDFRGDAAFPPIDFGQWKLVNRVEHRAWEYRHLVRVAAMNLLD